jgi:hypothetical protein
VFAGKPIGAVLKDIQALDSTVYIYHRGNVGSQFADP